jgi:peptidyl-prolyl cis-trans isomerase D
VRYLFFDPQGFRSTGSVSDADLQEYFDNHAEEYRNPATVEARHILLKIDDGAPAARIEQQRLKAEEIQRQAAAGQDFVALAKQHSEGPDREEGGYLGTFPREAMVKPFADAAFSLPEGGISQPVLTPFGWHIIKVEKINAASTRPFSEVASEIRRKIEERRARELAYEAAVATYDATLAGTSFDQAASARQLPLLEAGPFGPEGPPTGPAEPRPFAAAALAMAEAEISDVKEFKDGFYLIQIAERVAERLLPFDEVQGRVQADWQRQWREDQAREAAERALAGLKGGETPEAVAAKALREWTISDFFRRDEAIPGLGREEEIAAEAFKLTAQTSLCDKVIKGKGGFFIVRLLERKAPDSAGFEAQRAEIERTLLQQKQFKAFSDLLAALRKGSRIRIEERLFD